MGKFKKKRAGRRILASLLCLVLIMSYIPMQSVFASSDTDKHDQTSNEDIVRNLDISYKLKNQDSYTALNASDTIADISKVDNFHCSLSFQLMDTQDPQTGAAVRTVTEGDYFEIELPEELTITSTGGQILGNDDKAIAEYSFVKGNSGKWVIKVTFTDYVDNSDEYDIIGALDFEFTLDASGVKEGTSSTISIPISNDNTVNIQVSKPAALPTTPKSLSKTVQSYDEMNREITWKVNITPNTSILSGYVFTDKIDTDYLSLKSVKHGNITLVEGTDYTYDDVTGELIYTIPEGRDGTDFQNLYIVTGVKGDVYASTQSVTVSNQANLSGGDYGVDIDSNIASQTITPQWLKKSGTLYEGNKISWTITANSSQQAMYDAVITDSFQSDVELDTSTVKWGGTSIAVYDSTQGYTPQNDTEVYAIYTTNADHTSYLDIYLPRGTDNASSSTQTITLITNVVPDENGTIATKTYNNTVSITGKFISDGNGVGVIPAVDIGQVGVSVPAIWIDKSHNNLTAQDKADGTITWTIKATSNVSNYGASTIVDTLPEGQTYLANEIYYGTQKIDETTEPSAVIDESGRVLTITFTQSNALSTQQNFSVKTQIDTQIYGTNISQNFRNSAKVNLYENTVNSSPVASSSDTDSVYVSNTVISKSASISDSNDTKNGINPRVDYTITINSNCMPISNVVVSDDLNNIITSFMKEGDSSASVVDNVKWTYVPDTLSISKQSGSTDHLNLSEISNNATYENNQLSVSFGEDVAINDCYVIKFSAELDLSQNNIFQENGTIINSKNTADIVASGLKTGTITSSPTGDVSITNQVLSKSGSVNQNDQQVNWSIRLNQHSLQLDDTSVVDELPLGLTLDPTSIKLYTDVIDSSGNFIQDWALSSQGKEVDFSYTYQLSDDPQLAGRYVLTVNLPSDETDYILTFATDVSSSVLGQQITNSAYFSGSSAGNQTSGSTSIKLFSSSTGSSTSKGSIIVYKKDVETQALLSNTSFALYWIDASGQEQYVRTLTTDSSGTVTFRGLTKGQTYTVEEVSPTQGYANNSSGSVSVVVPETGTSPASLTFYDSQIKTGSWVPQAIKKLNGKAISRDFYFEIEDGTSVVLNGETDQELSNGDYAASFSLSDGVDSEGILSFTDSYAFAQSDPDGTEHLVTTKSFVMKETAEVAGGYTFDTTEYHLTVKVYNVKGQSDLKIVIEDEDGNVLSDDQGNLLADKIPVFTNSYEANGTLQLTAQKTLVGHALSEGQFVYDLYEGDSLVASTTNAEGTQTSGNSDTADIVFPEIHYTQADVGVKTYRIVEQNTGLSGYSYDSTQYIITVSVTDNNNGTVSANINSIQKELDGQTETVQDIAFTNEYTTSDVSVQLIGTKTLSGHAITDHQFTFTMNQVSEDGTLIQELDSVSNIGNTIDFPELNFTQSDIGKTYYYQISEENGDKSGYTYDASIYTVEIKVVDNNNGTLSVQKAITKDGASADDLSFTNQYQATGGLILTAQNTLMGETLTQNQFAFSIQELTGINGTPIGDAVIAKNTSDGNISFPDINYTQQDVGKTYYYQITQIYDNQDGYTYDDSVYKIKVSVIDNGDGTVSANIDSIQKQLGDNLVDVSEIAFANIYVTPVVSEDKNETITMDTDQNANVSQDVDENETVTMDSGVTPDTGDYSGVLLYAFMLFASLLIAFVSKGYRLKRKRRL